MKNIEKQKSYSSLKFEQGSIQFIKGMEEVSEELHSASGQSSGAEVINLAFLRLVFLLLVENRNCNLLPIVGCLV